MNKQQILQSLNILILSTDLLSKEAVLIILKANEAELERLILNGTLKVLRIKKLVLISKSSVLSLLRNR